MKEVSVLLIFDVDEETTNPALEDFVNRIFLGWPVRPKYILIPQEIEIQRGPRSGQEIRVVEEFVVCQEEGCGLPVQIDADGVGAHCPDGHSFLDFKPLRLG